MTIVTGTSDFQQLFQGLLAETVNVDGNNYGVPIVKLTADSDVGGGGVAATVDVSNFPAVQSVNIVSGTVSATPPIMQGVSGSVSVSNIPILQGVSGTVAVQNFPSDYKITGSVSVDNFPPLQAISGTIGISNFPLAQGISGSVGISNFPSDYKITGSVFVNNFPQMQGISGTVSVNNLPQTQVVSGTVFVGNFPNPQIVSGSVLSLDFPTYAEWDYFGDAIYSGTNLYHAVFRRGGATGTVVATINMTYDSSDNLLTVTRT